MQRDRLPTPYVLTADIGGSHITAAVCDILTNTVIPESMVRIELSSKGSADNILKAWADAFQQSKKNAGVAVSALGIAMPGPFDYENGISYITGLNKYESLYGMNIKAYLTGVLTFEASAVRFRNDAEATVAGEVLAGAGLDFNNVVGVTLGTGFGSAHCENGVTRDINLGSMPFKDSIADDHLSTRWFLKRYNELTGMSVQGVKELALIAEKNKTAQQVFKEFANNMSDFMEELLKEIQPEVLILCGNIARASAYFMPQLKRRIGIPIQLAQLGEQAALIGVAGLFDTIPADNMRGTINRNQTDTI